VRKREKRERKGGRNGKRERERERERERKIMFIYTGIVKMLLHENGSNTKDHELSIY